MAMIHDTDRFSLTHAVDVFYDEASRAEAAFDPSAHRWRAECCCGWVSEWHNEPGFADHDGDEHRDSQAGPGDGLDAVMGDLLDLQDSLAEVVVWLAENWSADLPVPIVYASDGGIGFDPARVKVAVCCLDPAELTRIGHLLGVPPVDDEHPNSQRKRYRNVCRDFGRVTLHAFHRLPDTTGRAS